jgi:class 3 adenylate cyclase
MEFRILGSLEVVERGRALPLGGRARALLAFFLLHPNELASSDRLIDALWGERPPETAQAALQVHVSQLRKALGADRIQTRAPGYLFRLEPEELDASRFEALLAQGRGRDALALWRGPALAEFVYEPWAQGEIARLQELRLAGVEERIEAELAGGRHAQLVSELEALVREQPLRERLRGQLMLALYRCGRQAEALALYQETRRLLVEELGIEPGQELQALHRQVLNQDAALAPPPIAAEEPAPPELREERKVVTVLFCDLAESTALGDRLDPEVQRRVLSRYFECVSHVLQRHGGTVEKFIGDAVMAVFGVPRLHEEDALRAVRAATELQEAIEVLNAELTRDHGIELHARIGVNTGEVIVGDQPLVTGDTVNVAARLEQAAPPGGVLLGETTFELVREAVRGEPVELELKGKPTAVGGWRLLELEPGAAPFARRLDTPLVGRELELEQLRQGLARAVRERRAVLLTVVGPAGIGKTRLVGEFVASVSSEARALVGRCLPYGEGITFWPLVEIVRELAGDEPRDALLELLGAEEEREAVVNSILGAVGGEAAASTEESFWAARKLFESLAREQPLVVCFEDVHWAEATLLDLIQHLTEWTSDAPLLLLCLARPEFVDEEGDWVGGGLNVRSIVLDPLTEEESERLIDLLGDTPLDPSSRARLRERTGGNPLFVEQMLALLSETPGADDLSLPPTIHALLAARLERLDPRERAVIERAAVIGQEFWLGAVSDLSADGSEQTVRRHLQELVRKDLVRPHRSFLSGEDAFVFNHVLIRDAAYRSIAKELRAELHQRFAEWVERKPGEYEEIFAYHLEQAYLHRSELGPLGARERALGEKAAQLLHTVGRRAVQRGDLPAAENLLLRASKVLEPGAAALSALRRDLAIVQYDTGRYEDAETSLVSLIESAGRSGDRAAKWAARTQLARLRMTTASGVDQCETGLEVGLKAVEVLQEEGDEANLALAWLCVADAHNILGRMTARRDAAERALAIARRAGEDEAETEREALGSLGTSLFIGPTPVDEGIARLEPELARARADGRLAIEASVLGSLGILNALRAQFDQARVYIERRISIFEDLGITTFLGMTALGAGQTELLANRTEAAADVFRRGYDLLARLGETAVSSTLAAMLANALAVQGDGDEALRFAQISAETSEEIDAVNRFLIRTARARALDRMGRLGEAEALAREAAALAMETEFLYFQPFVLLDLAHVLRTAGKEAEAVPFVEQAIALCERKGNIPTAERARALLAELAAVEV